MIPQYGRVFEDIRDGFLAWHIWGRLGWRETRLRYMRTAIGPFWTALNLGIFIVVMGILWSQLWKTDPKVYLPFLTCGMITWLLFSTITLEGCSTFTHYELLIKQLPISYTLLACSVVWRNLIVFGHNLLIYVLVMLYAGSAVNWSLLLVIPGLILLALNGVWIALVLGLLCTRYRDIQQLIQSLMQIAMFLTPIFWQPGQLPGRAQVFVQWNLLSQYIEIVRGPLIGQVPQAWSWIMVSAATVLGWTLMLVLHSRFRRRIAYWL